MKDLIPLRDRIDALAARKTAPGIGSIFADFSRTPKPFWPMRALSTVRPVKPAARHLGGSVKPRRPGWRTRLRRGSLRQRARELVFQPGGTSICRPAHDTDQLRAPSRRHEPHEAIGPRRYGYRPGGPIAGTIVEQCSPDPRRGPWKPTRNPTAISVAPQTGLERSESVIRPSISRRMMAQKPDLRSAKMRRSQHA